MKEAKNESEMTRGQFLKRMGFAGASLLAVYCMGSLSSCQKNTVIPSGPKDFTLNLDDAQFQSLKTVGNYLVVQEVVIACVAVGTYAAVTVVCSHEGQKRVAYRKTQNDFYCSAHGALYDIGGKGKNSDGSAGLTLYHTTLSGSNLRIYS